MRVPAILLGLAVLGQSLFGFAPGLCFRDDRVCHVYWANALRDGCEEAPRPMSSGPASCTCPGHGGSARRCDPDLVPSEPSPVVDSLRPLRSACRNVEASWGALIDRSDGTSQLGPAAVVATLPPCPPCPEMAISAFPSAAGGSPPALDPSTRLRV